MQYSPLPEWVNMPCEKAGTLRRIEYDTRDEQGQQVRKDALVYLPWGYEAAPEQRHPVLYLMHGGGGDSNEFFGGLEGRSGLKQLLDHAIASGRVQPMIAVAPSYCMPGREEARRSIDVAVQLTHRFPKELQEDLIPAVDGMLRTHACRACRAFGGFSMGGETTWSVLADAAAMIGTVVPMSGDYWAMGLKGGRDYPEETADALISRLARCGVQPRDVRVLAFTGDRDIAWEAMAPMVQALARRSSWFTPMDAPSRGNLAWCVKPGGEHTYRDCMEYIWLALPYLFRQGEAQA